MTSGALDNAAATYPEMVAYVTKFLPNGGLGYSALLGDATPTNGGSGLIGPSCIAVDSSGSAYISGAAGTLWPTTQGAYQTEIPGDAPSSSTAPFVVKVSADGSSLVYSTFLGGLGGGSTPTSITVNGAGEVFVAGYGASAGFPITSNAYQKTPGNSLIGSFFSELNGSGSVLIYSSFFS